MSGHTKEPWRALHSLGNQLRIVAKDAEPFEWVAELRTSRYAMKRDVTQEADAARIVACVNALEGIADPSAALKDARQALRLALPYVQNCYECAFPSDSENASVESAIVSALLKLGGAR